MATVPINNMTDTWNASGTAFSSIKMNVTNTASAAASKLLDLQIAGSTVAVIYPNTSNNGCMGVAPFGSSTLVYFGTDSNNNAVLQNGPSSGPTTTLFATGADAAFTGNPVGVKMASSGAIAWGPSGGPGQSTNDTALFRQGIGILALVNGTNTNAFRIYGTTDTNAGAGTNYARLTLDTTPSANKYLFGPQAGGTGTLAYMQQTVAFASNPPATKTTAYTQTLADEWLIFNGGASITLTLLNPATYPGLTLYVKTIAAFTVVSASSNVVPRGSATAGTAILAGAAGNWALLVSDGTNWVIMAGTP